MAAVEEKIKDGHAPEGETPSMEEILKSIRGVISGDDYAQEDDILELTDMAEEYKVDETQEETQLSEVPLVSVETQSNEFIQPTDVAITPEKSILDDIDEALGNQEIQPTVTAVVEEDKFDTSINDIEEDEMSDSDLTDDNLSYAAGGESKKGKSLHLLGDVATKQSSYPLKELVNSIHDKPVPSPYTRTGTSLEDLVIEAMKPFLAEWLNENLPIIVKKIVAKEIKRIIPKDEDDD